MFSLHQSNEKERKTIFFDKSDLIYYVIKEQIFTKLNLVLRSDNK